MPSPFVLIALAVVPILLTAIWHVSTIRRYNRLLIETTTGLTVKGVAATLAAPHLNPNPEAIEDNLVILDAWERTAARYLQGR